MTCRELVDFLMDYLNRELPPDQQSAFELHLGLCPPCVAFVHSYEEAIRMGKCACTDLDAPVPDAVPQSLIDAILAARRADESAS